MTFTQFYNWHKKKHILNDNAFQVLYNNWLRFESVESASSRKHLETKFDRFITATVAMGEYNIYAAATADIVERYREEIEQESSIVGRF